MHLYLIIFALKKKNISLEILSAQLAGVMAS